MRRAGTAENGFSPVHGAVFGGAGAVGNLFGALGCVLLVVLGASCSAPATSLRQSTFPPNPTTFALVRSEAGANTPDGFDEALEQSLREQLVERGLSETPRARADLIVTVYVDTLLRQELKAPDSFCYAGSDGQLPPGNQWDVQSGCDDYVLTPIERQRLVIAVYDRARNQLVWHGWGSTKSANTLFAGDDVSSTIHDILEHFPD